MWLLKRKCASFQKYWAEQSEDSSVYIFYQRTTKTKFVLLKALGDETLDGIKAAKGIVLLFSTPV